METEPSKPSFWAELFTAPRLISFVVMLAGGAMWVQAFRSEVAQLRAEVASFKADYQRSDTLRYELSAIRDEQQRMRQQLDRYGAQQDKMAESVAGLRRDLR
jgi:Tfp pilus assembly protein PilO